MQENKELILELFDNNIKRTGADKLKDWLINSDFFTAPASTRFHLSCEGGLAQHSLNVYNRLIKEIKSEYESVENSPYLLESLVIVGLLHDVCKVDFYEVEMRNVKNKLTNKWEQEPFYKINDKLPIEHSSKSQYIIRSFIELTRDESIAIMSHMGAFDSAVKGGSFTIVEALKKFELALLLHIADLKATDIDEKKTF
ncbi:hypothetical protein AN641_00685 [Candidatus Epulonipiscioides gigas]|nr:hypothetical protein AN641_00685 [Epulopiscium sp. SCG-C07WGA-EpuloA2]